MNDFQERLEELLELHKLNRLQFANIIGIAASTINDYFNKGYYPEISIAKSMAKFFNCSLDYLLGLSDIVSETHNNYLSFFNTFKQLIIDSQQSISKTLRELKMSEYNYYRWQKGSMPKTTNLIEIAKYFGVSVDYLIGYTN